MKVFTTRSLSPSSPKNTRGCFFTLNIYHALTTLRCIFEKLTLIVVAVSFSNPSKNLSCHVTRFSCLIQKKAYFFFSFNVQCPTHYWRQINGPYFSLQFVFLLKKTSLFSIPFFAPDQVFEGINL